MVQDEFGRFAQNMQFLDIEFGFIPPFLRATDSHFAFHRDSHRFDQAIACEFGKMSISCEENVSF